MRKVLTELSEDRYLRAFGRQGIRELREITIAFPDSIAKEEPGGIASPPPEDNQKNKAKEEIDREPEQ